MIHELKTDPRPFDAVHRGAKTFEIRKADRPFDILDLMLLRETKHTGRQMDLGHIPNPDYPLRYTGREVLARITHRLDGPIYGLEHGWCILSFALVEVSDRPIDRDAMKRLDWNAPTALDPETLKRVEAWRDAGPLPRRAGPPLKAADPFAQAKLAATAIPAGSTLACLIGSGALVPPEVHPITLPSFACDGSIRGDRPSAYMREITREAAEILAKPQGQALMEKACPGRRQPIPPVTSWEQVKDHPKPPREATVRCHDCFDHGVIAGKPCPHCTSRHRRRS